MKFRAHWLQSTRQLTTRSWLAIALTTPLLQQSTSPALYMPRSVQRAFQKGTRSPNGRPGPNYWQNRARYSISVTALPPDRTVRGSEQITYWNNSPDTLRTAVIKLFLNIHKPGAPRAGGADADYLTPGVTIDAYAVNGQAAQPRNTPGTFTFQGIRLPTPLMPHDSVRLSIDWHYQISLLGNREGMVDSTSWFLAYYYPRIAVYDDTNGWDTMDFTDQQEFYSDFNDYDVTVKVPANFVVWGTGTLVNASTVLQPKHAQRFLASLTADTTVHVTTKEEMLAHQVTAQDAVNSWHFTASNVPDAAFALSDHYVWDATSVVVDDATHRRASAQAAFNDSAADYHHVAQYARHALDWLSHNWPGIPYPYEKTTVFEGPAGMEYPMMANDESYGDTTFSKFVAEHEIAHTYMPFYMGINETRYGFMDEGWATTFEYLIGTANMGKPRASEFFKQFRVNGWINDPSPLEDLPIITPGDMLKNSAYGNNAYGKAALGYLAVKDLLGDSLFKKSLHGYMERWNGKHPIPWDFFNSMNDVSGRNLNWFWNSWYFSNGYIDLAITSVKKSGAGYAVTLANVGGFPAPVDLVATYADGTTDTLHPTPAIWAANLQTTTVTIMSKKTLKSLTLDGGIWADAESANNAWLAH